MGHVVIRLDAWSVLRLSALNALRGTFFSRRRWVRGRPKLSIFFLLCKVEECARIEKPWSQVSLMELASLVTLVRLPMTQLAGKPSNLKGGLIFYLVVIQEVFESAAIDDCRRVRQGLVF